MADEYILKQFEGGAVPTTLAADITDTATSLTLTAGSTYPAGGTAPFVIVVDRGEATEEKILCASRASNTVTVQQRGYDGSSAQAHTAPATIEHVLDAYTIGQANRIVNGKSQAGASTTAGYPLVSGGASAPDYAQLGTAGIANAAVTAAKMEANFAQERVGGRWTMASTSFAHNVPTALGWTTENEDTDAMYPGSGSVFTIPAGCGGIWAIGLLVTGPTGWTLGQYVAYLYSASTGFSATIPALTTASESKGFVQVVWPLVAGDTFRADVLQYTGSSQSMSASLFAYRISR